MQALVNVVQRVGPYFVVALVMPGGIFIALGAWLYRRLAQRREQVREIRGRVAAPCEGLAVARMGEPQHVRMQHDARRGNARPVMVADIDVLADERVAELRQVDADLVLAPRLEAALDERRAA